MRHLSMLVALALVLPVVAAESDPLALRALRQAEDAQCLPDAAGETPATCGQALSGYIPPAWDGRSIYLASQKPEPSATLPVSLTSARFWPSACPLSGGADDINPCSTEARCETACGNLCVENTGQGVLQDIAPGVEHAGPHPTRRDCRTCAWDCGGGGQCVITCCRDSEDSTASSQRESHQGMAQTGDGSPLSTTHNSGSE